MSVAIENTGVDIAVGRLQELGDRMRSGGFDFKDSDVSNLEKIVIAINELEEERKLMHESLETESIKCSILRHDLKLLPGKIRDETMMAVTAARQLNADALKSLQDQLECMNNNIQDLDTKSSNLERENAILQPESELLSQQHEEIISQLNHKMAELAAMRINLNESRDTVKQVNQHVVDLEDGMIQLKEDLIQERTEAKNEKKELKKTVTDTLIKTRHQKEQNVVKKRELDGLQEKLIDSEGRLDSIRKSLKHYEASKLMLEVEENTLTTKLEQQHLKNEELHRQRAGLMKEIQEEQHKFDHEKSQFLKKIETFENDIAIQKKESVKLDKRKEQLQKDLKDKELIQQNDAATVHKLDEELQSVKQSLAKSAQEVGHLQNENAQLLQESQDLSASHKVVVGQLKKQIADLKEQLTKEKNERLEVQKRKEETGQVLNDLKLAQQQFMKDMTESIQEGKKKHTELSSEGQQLQKEIREIETEVHGLMTTLKTAQQKYEEMFNTMQSKVDAITGEILNTEKEIDSKQKILAEKTPIFEELEKLFSRRSNEYDGVKKSIVAQKVKKSGLEDAIKKGKKEIEDIKAPQSTLRSDIKVHNTQVISQMKQHGSDTKEIEQQIFIAGCQLRVILEENLRFEEACKKLDNDLIDLEIQAQENEKIKATAKNDLAREKREFVNKWKADNLMQEDFTTREQVVAEAFGFVVSKAEKRENKIDEVTVKLRKELQVLSDLLNNIASRKPSDVTTK